MRINRENSDQELLAAFHKSGDTEILGTIYNKYLHLAYGVCMKYLKDRDNAQDMVMEIFEKMIQKPPPPDINNFKTWLYVVVKNHCLMKLRKKDPKIISINQEDQFMEIPDEVHPIDKEDQISGLETCIEQLKREQKDCIELFYLQKKCYQEITDSTGFDLKKVKSYIQNGKRNLKICLEKNVGSESTY